MIRKRQDPRLFTEVGDLNSPRRVTPIGLLSVKIGSLLVGNLSLQVLSMNGWLRSQQMEVSQQHQEEEEYLSDDGR